MIRIISVIAAVALLLEATNASAAPLPVQITQEAGRVVLSNATVSATIDSENAQVLSIEYDGHEMVSRTGRHRNIYFSRDGGADYETLPHCTGSIANRSPEMIDYACKHTYSPGAGDKHAWDVEVHFVLRAGVNGLYVYTVNTHPASYPDLSVVEWRMVWSTPETPNDWLDTICVDQARHWKIPSPEDFARAIAVPGAPKEVTQLTSGSWAGRYDCKYMYAASYAEIGCWGFASADKHLGAFVVLPSTEFFNDGPNKQDLTSAVGTTLLHLNMNHYDGTGFTIRHGTAWGKCFGPWLLYFNNKLSADDCWHDAQVKVKSEGMLWPYGWMKHPAYAGAAQRGSVRGTLLLHDALHPELTAGHARVGLAPLADRPGADFQYSATGYQFWTRADSSGQFSISHVRPGNYTLYAYTDGVVGQFEKTDVKITGGAVSALDDLNWTVQHAGRKLAWEIGVPDRSAAEFGHGRDYYLPLMYQTLAKEMPEPLDYTVTKSDPATEWFYAQAGREVDGRRTPSHWRIHFALPQVPAGVSTLTLAFAGADRARLSVEVNDTPGVSVTPPAQGGNGLIREAIHTKYSWVRVPITADQLHAGDNTITLTQDGGASSYVMYDYLSLELPQ